ncbi:Type IV secretory pathway protein [Geoglobus ahangari]|uniref:Type IV secretory pathway protein n=1 Tax=Geoglobus ahangari TaxID=113653 RepID=A0A0F7DC76_9EURY|nr:type II/IV secretion system ATPase subunit [Geoglobus ahangari]AKG92356.1 Type IV secretory pathway protein [Geoglobus ahangari]
MLSNPRYDDLRRMMDDYGVEVLEEQEVPEGERLVDEYWVIDGIAKVRILENEESLKRSYNLMEPQVSHDEATLLFTVYEDVRQKLIYSMDDDAFSSLMRTVREVLNDYAVKTSDVLFLKMLYYFVRDFLGLGIVEPILHDENIEDVSCDGYDIPIFVYHRKYGNLATNITLDKETLDNYVLLLAQRANKHLSYANPIVDATLPDGSRIQITYGSEISTRGSTFTIRKFRSEPFTPIDLLELGTLSARMLAYFWLLIEHKRNLMVIGETASGKTTTLNALLMFIPPDSKVVSIEDTREIQLYHDNWIPEVTRLSIEGQEIDMYDLLKAALRQRPEYIIVGEVRGREAQTLFQAMATGHAAYATFHAGDVNQLIHRLEEEPLNVPRVLIQYLDTVIIQSRWVTKTEKKRRAKAVFEILGIEPSSKEILLNPVYKWDPAGDVFLESSSSNKLETISRSTGMSISEILEELDRRTRFLELMHARGVKRFRDVTRMISLYYTNPELAFSRLESED